MPRHSPETVEQADLFPVSRVPSESRNEESRDAPPTFSPPPALALRFLDHVFAAPVPDFLTFVIINPQIYNRITILSPSISTNTEIIFQINL